MRVQAIKRAYTRERLKQIAVDVSIQPGSVSISTKLPPKPKWALFDRSGMVDYTIVAPATANSRAKIALGFADDVNPIARLKLGDRQINLALWGIFFEAEFPDELLWLRAGFRKSAEQRLRYPLFLLHIEADLDRGIPVVFGR